MIKLFVGEKGSGKTLQMVKDAQWFFKRGYEVYSNFPVWGYSPEMSIRKRKPFERTKYLPRMGKYMYSEELEQNLKLSFERKQPTLFLLDEVPVMFHSREWKNFDLDLIHALNQSRKSNVHLYMSAQKFHAVDKQLRETAQYVYLCNKHFPKVFPISTVMVLKPDYFIEETKSVFQKKYIIKRKIYIGNSLKKYYKFYDTGQVILPQRFFEKFPEIFPDPHVISVDDIVQNSGKYTDTFIPI